MIKIENLSKTYQLPNSDQARDASELKSNSEDLILKDVNWQVSQKQFIALFGKSGSGKSTLLNVISGIDRPNAGRVLYNNQSLYDLDDDQLSDVRLKNFGYIFQTFNLISTLTAFENVEYPLVLMGIPESERKTRVREFFAAVGLTGQEQKLPSQLSGGQRQRVAIARALVKRPDVIFADEPTANLDEKTADEVLKLLVQLQNQYRSTIIYVTHDVDVMKYAEKRFQLSHGQIREFENV